MAEESHLDEMRAAIRGDFERLAERRGDQKLLRTIIENFKGGPVGLGTISASIHEERDSIEEIIEPYLIQIGLLVRTPRGRKVTPKAIKHFKDKLSDPRPAPGNLELFDSQ